MKRILLMGLPFLLMACHSAQKHDEHHSGVEAHGEKDECCGNKVEATKASPKKWELSISEEDFQKGYLENSAKLGMSCNVAAQEYCGKTTKDLLITEQEAGCLWAKAHRTTREKLFKLDKTPCEKLLKGIGPKKKK